ncbi:MAG: hypothetical protein AAGG56_04870 [Pseudomonadota bacterium]
MIEYLSWFFTLFATLIGLFGLSGLILYGNFATQIADLLKKPVSESLYQKNMTRLLDWVDRQLTPDKAPSGQASRIGKCAWNWPVFDFALWLAVAYPLVFLIATWVAGYDGKIGALDVMPATEDPLVRYGAAFLLVYMFLLFYVSKWASARKKRAAEYAFFGLVFAFAGAGAFAFAVAFAFTFAFAFSGAGAGAFAGTVAFSGAVGVAGAVAGAFALALVGAVSLGAQRGYGLVSYILLCLALLLAIATTSAAVELTEEVRGLLVFLALLPVLNGAFDFLSYGLTRYLLRRGVTEGGGSPILLGLVDLFGALSLFTLLGLTTILVLHLVNVVSPVPLAVPSEVLVDIRADPWAYGWLFFCLFSTLIPTGLHFFVSLFSAPQLLPWLTEPLARALEHTGEHFTWALKATALLLLYCGIWLAVVVFGFVAFFEGGAWLLSTYGWTYLSLFDWCDGWLASQLGTP